LKFVLFNTLTH